MSTCPSCRGDGYYLHAPPLEPANEEEASPIEVACPDCNGSGRVSPCDAPSSRHTHCTKPTGHHGSHYDGDHWWSFDLDTRGG